MTELERQRQGYRAAWALFQALEREEFAAAQVIAEEWDAMLLQQGLTLVAAVLRLQLQAHAESLGCDCGSRDWMDRNKVLSVYEPPEPPDHTDNGHGS